MLVVTRLRVPSPDPAAEAELRAGLLRALDILAAQHARAVGRLVQIADAVEGALA